MTRLEVPAWNPIYTFRREMNKNLLKSKTEMAALIDKQQSEIEDLSSINRDLMIHLEAAQKINNQEKFLWIKWGA